MRVEGTKQGRTPSSLALPLAPDVTVWPRRLAPYAARDWAPVGEVITRRRGGTQEEQVGRSVAPVGSRLAHRAFSSFGSRGPQWLSRASLPVRLLCVSEVPVADATLPLETSLAELATPGRRRLRPNWTLVLHLRQLRTCGPACVRKVVSTVLKFQVIHRSSVVYHHNLGCKQSRVGGLSSAVGGCGREMTEYLASIFGTEKDKVNCSFYFKIGACRHGDRCLLVVQ
ncbi:hypothetical protein QTO34_014564 [Cnephaeus nilssonii]|uniref:C3H1-type domain-containing protein n=1 Tax=Cnephaeus nilssonii TaxID=3371016 RepID=A0AA40I6T5_CNENI|nr:hypothetical protein QTO34_014564 [Eptesicus nilssonii]